MPFIQVTEVVLGKGRNAPPTRRDLWLNVHDIKSVIPLVAEECHGANSLVASSFGGNLWWLEETAGKVALMLEEAEGKQGSHDA